MLPATVIVDSAPRPTTPIFFSANSDIVLDTSSIVTSSSAASSCISSQRRFTSACGISRVGLIELAASTVLTRRVAPGAECVPEFERQRHPAHGVEIDQGKGLARPAIEEQNVASRAVGYRPTNLKLGTQIADTDVIAKSQVSRRSYNLTFWKYYYEVMIKATIMK